VSEREQGALPSRSEPTMALDRIYAAFARSGYDGLSFQQLAGLLGLSSEELAVRYPRKYDLWYAALCQASEDLVEYVAAGVTAQTPLERLRQACYATVAYGLQRPDCYAFVTMPRSSTMDVPEEPAPGVIAFRALLQRLVKQCIKAGDFAPHRPELVAQGLIVLFASMVQLQRRIQRLPWSEQLAAHLIETYLAGLRVSEPAPDGGPARQQPASLEER
jgi:AcrR family transcriptional regulator